MRDFERNFNTDEINIRLRIPITCSDKATFELTQQGVVNISYMEIDQLGVLNMIIGDAIVELRKKQMY